MSTTLRTPKPIRLTDHQMRELAACAVPTTVLLNPGRTANALVTKGLLRRSDITGVVCIAPAGLRALADAIEAGTLRDGLDLARDHREGNISPITAATKSVQSRVTFRIGD